MSRPSRPVVVLVTASSEEEAVRIGRKLVEDRLAACANIVPKIRSIFQWEGKVAEERECLVILKTRGELLSEVEGAVLALHSYQVPEIIALPIEGGSAPYLEWINEETRKR